MPERVVRLRSSGTSYAVAGRQWVSSADPRSVPDMDRSSGDATHQRQPRTIRPADGIHESASGRVDLLAAVSTDTPTTPTPAAPQGIWPSVDSTHIRAAGSPRATRSIRRRCNLRRACWRRHWPPGHCAPDYDAPIGRVTTGMSCATQAWTLLKSGPAGSLASIGHGAGDHGGRQAEILGRIVVVNGEPDAGVGDQVPGARASIGAGNRFAART